MSRGTLSLEHQVRLVGLPAPTPEFRFHPTRKWRFDFAWPDKSIAVEVDGAVYTGGRHTRGAGFEKDMEKLNTAVLMGWAVLRFSTGMVRDGRALNVIERLLTGVTSADSPRSASAGEQRKRGKRRAVLPELRKSDQGGTRHRVRRSPLLENQSEG